MVLENEILTNVSLLAACVLVSLTITNALKLSPIFGYFASGMIVGPYGYGIFSESLATITFADMGIVFLMFSLGLKFSLNSLFAMRRFVVGLGALQAFSTMLVFGTVAYYYTGSLLTASLIGFVAAMSSTALVSQILLQENTLVSPTGRRAMGVLLFQDLLVFPLVALYSFGKDVDGMEFLFDNITLLGKAILFLMFVYLVGSRIIKWSLHNASQSKYKEVFVINVIAIIVIVSWSAKTLGLPDMFGAFLVGILLADSTNKFNIERVVEPTRQITLAFFFIYVGMLLSPSIIKSSLHIILYLSVLVILVKLIIMRVCLVFFRTYTFVSWDTAILLSGCGELGLILLSVGHHADIITKDTLQILLSVNILTMLSLPLFYKHVQPYISKFTQVDNWKRSADLVYKNVNTLHNMRGHVIVGGFGRTGQSIIKLLGEINIPCIAIERDFAVIEAVGLGTSLGTGTVHGEYENYSALLSVGILRAKMFIIPSYDSTLSVEAAKTARQINPNITIIATVPSVYHAEKLLQAGVDKVMVFPMEMGFSYAYDCIETIVTDTSEKRDTRAKFYDITQDIRALKKDKYLAYFSGSYEAESVNVLIGCKVGTAFDTTYLLNKENNIKIILWKRGGNELTNSTTEKIAPGDILVLSGDIPKLTKAKEQLIACDTEEE